MYPYIETIKIEKGEARNLRFHQERFMRTRAEMLGLKSHPCLADEIIIPAQAKEGIFKCRVIYDQKMKPGWSIYPYVRPDIRSLKLIPDNQISYPYKSTDRSALSACINKRLLRRHPDFENRDGLPTAIMQMW